MDEKDKLIEEMRSDIMEVANTLDCVMDDFYDVCGYRDDNIDALVEKIRARYGKETKGGEGNASKEN